MTRPGDERRRVILERAMRLASVDGLEGLTLGQLAADLGISKGGLQALFGTKEDLQLAIVAAATELFEHRVLRTAEQVEDGLPRLRALMDAWIDYLDDFPGGCFFTAAASEFDGREGPVREAIVDVATAGHETLRKQIRLACRLGELVPDVDVDQLVFELHAATLEANFARQLLREANAFDRARQAIHERLDSLSLLDGSRDRDAWVR